MRRRAPSRPIRVSADFITIVEKIKESMYREYGKKVSTSQATQILAKRMRDLRLIDKILRQR